MMKISKCKKELARIISEHGGWRNGEFAAQDGDGSVGGYDVKPEWNSLTKYWWREARGEWFLVNKIKNHHQTVLSRAEYFHLYQAPDVDATDKLSSEAVSAAKIALMSDSIEELVRKPTIEQLAADYRNKLDCANRKQDEADKANMESDAALSQLEDAIAAIGFVITPLAATEKEPELVAAVKVGDQVECVESNIKRDKYNGMVGRMHFIDESDTSTPYLVDFGGAEKIWCHEVKFIRRP